MFFRAIPAGGSCLYSSVHMLIQPGRKPYGLEDLGVQVQTRQHLLPIFTALLLTTDNITFFIDHDHVILECSEEMKMKNEKILFAFSVLYWLSAWLATISVRYERRNSPDILKSPVDTCRSPMPIVWGCRLLSWDCAGKSAGKQTYRWLVAFFWPSVENKP